jgi:putative RecB family exonuclease
MNGHPYRSVGRALMSPTPGQVLESLTGRDYLSPSQISSFQSCSLRWWYAYVAKAKPESTSATLIFGSAVHAAIEKHLGAMVAQDPAPTIDELVVEFSEKFDKESSAAPIQFSKGDTPDSLRSLARQILVAYLEHPVAHPEGQILGIEQTLRVSLDPALPGLVGRVDLMTYHEGIVRITDFKTTKAIWTDETAEANAQQLSLYAQAAAPLAKELGAEIRLSFVLLTKHKTPRVEAIEVSADPDKVRRSTVVLRQVFNAMKAGNIYPSPSQMNCYSCPFQKRCKAWHLQPEAS